MVMNLNNLFPRRPLARAIEIFSSSYYCERLLNVDIGNEVIAGSRKVLFQAATNKLRTYLDGTQAA